MLLLGAHAWSPLGALSAAGPALTNLGQTHHDLEGLCGQVAAGLTGLGFLLLAFSSCRHLSCPWGLCRDLPPLQFGQPQDWLSL